MPHPHPRLFQGESITWSLKEGATTDTRIARLPHLLEERGATQRQTEDRPSNAAHLWAYDKPVLEYGECLRLIVSGK
jgi:hypothetical protein